MLSVNTGWAKQGFKLCPFSVSENKFMKRLAYKIVILNMHNPNICMLFTHNSKLAYSSV